MYFKFKWAIVNQRKDFGLVIEAKWIEWNMRERDKGLKVLPVVMNGPGKSRVTSLGPWST